MTDKPVPLDCIEVTDCICSGGYAHTIGCLMHNRVRELELLVKMRPAPEFVVDEALVKRLTQRADSAERRAEELRLLIANADKESNKWQGQYEKLESRIAAALAVKGQSDAYVIEEMRAKLEGR
jgi:hypothetical protein